MATATTEAPAAAAEEAKGGGKKKLIIIIAVLAIVGGAVYWFFLKPKPEVTSWPAPVAGTISPLDPITVNLADGHFLKLGMAIQFSAAAGEETDGSKALDLAITQFSNKSVSELSSAEGRDKNKEELVEKIVHAYDEVGEKEEADAKAAAATAGSDATDEEAAAEESADEGTESAEEKTPYAEVLSRTFAYDVYFTSFVMQ